MVATKEEQLAEIIAKATQIAQQTNVQTGVYVPQQVAQSSVVN